MSILIDLGDGIKLPATVNEKSGLLYDIYQYQGEGGVANLGIVLKNIHEDSVANYVYFLTHKERPPIVDQETVIDCFEIYITELKTSDISLI